MQKIRVNAASGTYEVVCLRGALEMAGALVAARVPPGAIILLSSPKVWRHWGRRAQKSFGGFGESRKVLFDDREAAKTLRTVEGICRALVKAGADREITIVAMGGGVVGDVAGFVAASYLRGVKLVHLPTTLVAQVDSAIGGKTGVNLPEGKNLVGAFYQPALVIADPEVLRTLPAREYRSGLYEVIKYAVIGDRMMFEELEKRMEALARREVKSIDWAIPRCVAAKARVVNLDERESGSREILNFGHTFGHALEAATRYKYFLHGEAVGWGMIAAAHLAAELDRLPPNQAARIENLVRRVGRLPYPPKISSSHMMELMRADKKARGGRMRFVLPTEIGKVEVVEGVEERVVQETILSLREQSRVRR